MSKQTAIKNRKVGFRACDAYFPSPLEILDELHGTGIIQGVVMDVTTHSGENKRFAVIKVDGLTNYVIVPFDKIISVS